MAINDAAAAGIATAPLQPPRRGSASTPTGPARRPAVASAAPDTTVPPAPAPLPDGDRPPTSPAEDLVGEVAAAVRAWLTDVVGRAPGRPVAVLVEADPGRLRVLLTGDGCGPRQDGGSDGPAGPGGRTLHHGGDRTAEDQDEGGLRMRWSGPLT